MAAAASSATGATTAYYIPCQHHHQHRVSSKTYRVPITSPSVTRLHATKQRRVSVVIRNSGEENAAVTEEETETPVELPKGPPSIISVLNVEKALRGVAITEVDHYGRLGLPSDCSYQQVEFAYKSKVAEMMNKGLDEDQLSKELDLLKESHSILSTVEERRLYDWSLVRSGNPDNYMWPFEVDNTPTSTADPPPQEPEDERPTTLTGYFFISWLILSFILLIVFNR